MVHLEIKNVKSNISGLTDELLEELSTLLSFEVNGADHIKRVSPQWGWDGRKRLLKKSTLRPGVGSFPTGLASVVINFLKINSLEYEVKNSRERPELSGDLVMNGDITYRDYQKDIIDITGERDRGVIVLATGGGKTITAGGIIESKGVDTLFVVPNLGLKKQTSKKFKELFGSGYVGEDVTKEHPIIVANIDSLTKKDPKYFKRFKMLKIDEFHHASADGYLNVNQKCHNAYHRYGLTGSFIRPDGTDMVMHGVLSSVIYEKNATDLIKEGWLVKPNVNVIRHRLKGYSSLNYKNAYDKAIQDNDINQMISDIAMNEGHYEGKQVLVLVRRIEHGQLLNRMIEDSTFVYGGIKIEERGEIQERFANKEIRILIANNVFGEGIDIPSIEVLVNGRLQASEIQTVQGIGRALRTTDGKNVFSEGYDGKVECDVYDFLLAGNKHLHKHSIQRLNTYKNEPAFDIKFPTLSDHQNFF